MGSTILLLCSAAMGSSNGDLFNYQSSTFFNVQSFELSLDLLPFEYKVLYSTSSSQFRSLPPLHRDALLKQNLSSLWPFLTAAAVSATVVEYKQLTTM